jgi:cytochrome c-type biogenesis protein
MIWLTAFLAGISSFFASCVLPLVPIYLSFLAGYALSESKTNSKSRWNLFSQALIFVFFFVLAFSFLGLFAGTLGGILHVYRVFIRQIGGIMMLAFAFILFGSIEIPWLQREFKLNLPKIWEKNAFWSSALLGLTFAIGWSPCIGPVLATIFFYASQQTHRLEAVLLLTVYGLGIGLPFLIIALFYEPLIPILKRLSVISRYLQIITASALFLGGLYFLLGK